MPRLASKRDAKSFGHSARSNNSYSAFVPIDRLAGKYLTSSVSSPPLADFPPLADALLRHRDLRSLLAGGLLKLAAIVVCAPVGPAHRPEDLAAFGDGTDASSTLISSRAGPRSGEQQRSVRGASGHEEQALVVVGDAVRAAHGIQQLRTIQVSAGTFGESTYILYI